MKRLMCLLAMMLVLPAFALEVTNLDDASHLAGPKLSKADLEGKVILLEFFGYGCGPCIAAMPGTVKVVESFKEDGRVVGIASHAWPRNEKGLASFWKSVGGAQMPAYQELLVAGIKMPRGVPHAYVIGADGTTVWEGHPANHAAMEAAVKDALKALPKVQPKKSLKEEFERRKSATQRRQHRQERRAR